MSDTRTFAVGPIQLEAPPAQTFSMPDDFTLKVSLLTATVLGVLSLFLSWYLRRDPVVSSYTFLLS